MGDRITAIRPGPKPCPFRGVAYPVHEARLCDLVELQAFVDSRWPEPDLWGDLAAAGDDPLARDRALFGAYGAYSEGPPTLDSVEGGNLLYGTEAGMTLFLSVALRGVPEADVPYLVGAIDAGTDEALAWFAAVKAAFDGADPLRIVTGLLGLPPDRPRGEPLTWGECVMEVCQTYGWTLDYVLGLGVTEFVCARRGGRPRETGLRPPVADQDAFFARMHTAIHGVPPEPPVAVRPTP